MVIISRGGRAATREQARVVEAICPDVDLVVPCGMAVDFYQSGLLAGLDGCAHGVTQRGDGVSVGTYASLNLGLHVGDNPSAVRENRRRAAEGLGFDRGDVVCAAQVHGGAVAVVDAAHRGRGARTFADCLPEVDALVTNTPGLLLTLCYADCIPVLFADPCHSVVGVAHAGWRGIVAGVVENTVAAMASAFGSAPGDLIAAIGPGIGACCFEVGDETAAQFPIDVVHRADNPVTKPHVDLKAAVRQRLRTAGIENERIDTCPDCTVCTPERYFSHRRDAGHNAGQTGRFGALIGIRSRN